MNAPRRRQNRDASLFIEDILHQIDRINNYAGVLTQEAFLADANGQSVVIHGLIVIGEAARAITGDSGGPPGDPEPLDRERQAFKDRNGELWDTLLLARDMRNILVHEYFRVDPGVVWDAIKNDLPRLQELLARAVAHGDQGQA